MTPIDRTWIRMDALAAWSPKVYAVALNNSDEPIWDVNVTLPAPPFGGPPHKMPPDPLWHFAVLPPQSRREFEVQKGLKNHEEGSLGVKFRDNSNHVWWRSEVGILWYFGKDETAEAERQAVSRPSEIDQR
jgi:hypothetical protein